LNLCRVSQQIGTSFEYDDSSGRTSPAPSEIDDPGCIDELSSGTDDEEEEPINEIKTSDDELDSEQATTSSIVALQTALDFIEALKRASLDNGDLDDETLHRL
jgi:hypothetical protein